MNSFNRFRSFFLIISIILLQYSCTVSGGFKIRGPGGNVKVDSKHHKDHHDDDHDDDKKKKKHGKKKDKDKDD